MASSDIHNNVSGDWSDGSKWLTGAPPGSAADAEFIIGGPAYTVSVTDTELAGSVLLDADPAVLAIATGGNLLLGSPAETPTLTLQAGTLDLSGKIGSFDGRPLTIVESGGATIYHGGTLSDVAIQGTLDLSAAGASLVSANGLAVRDPTTSSNPNPNPGTIAVTGAGSHLTFATDTTLTKLNLIVGNAANSTVTVQDGATLTIATDSLLKVNDVQTGMNSTTNTPSIGTIDGPGTLVVNGRIGVEETASGLLPETPYQTLNLLTASVENNGRITVGGGYNGAMLVVGGALTGTGLLRLMNSAATQSYGDATNLQVVVELKSTVAATQTINFAQSDFTTLKLDAVNASAPTAVAATITGLEDRFGFDQVIDLTGVAWSDTLTASVDGNRVLTVKNGSVVEGVLNTDLQPGRALRLFSDGNGGTDIAVCYAAGTRIRAVRGDIAVEELRIGDLVVTVSGARRPIRWLGHRRVDCRRHPRPHECMPVRVAAHAFGPDKPVRDLVVSPGHSLCVDVVGEVLIPACAIVNGSTIVQEDVDHVTYWHVELDSHDIILAENMPAESYLEMGNRSFFADGDVIALDASPDAPARTHADFCRPFHADGALVDAVRAQLGARAEALGWRLDAGDGFAGLHLMADGVRIEPVCRGLSARLHVPAGTRDAWLVCDAVRPPGSDPRTLGLFLAGMSLDDCFAPPRAIDLADARLRTGFHDLEDGRRWTGGRAHLPEDLWADCADAFFLRLDLAGPALPRWVAPAATRDLAAVAG